MELKAQIQAIMSSAKDSAKAELESGEAGGPVVEEADIANIVAQWTGIPIEKVSSDETERLVDGRGTPRPFYWTRRSCHSHI